MLLVSLITVPLIAAFVSLAARRQTVLEVTAVVAGFLELIAVLALAFKVAVNGAYVFNSYFSVDALGTLVVLVVAVIGSAAAFYSIGYVRAEVAKKIIGFRRVRQYFILFHLFLMAMFFAVSTANPILMWIAIEATTLATALLISFYNKPTAMEAAWKYLIINSIGLLLGFFGTLLFFSARGSTSGLIDWQALVAHASSLSPFIVRVAFVFILVGYGTKVGLVPMHSWKPDAYSKTPTPIAAVFSGPLLTVAFLAILRFKIVTDAAVGPAFSQRLFIFFGFISLLIPAFIILVQKNYKRLLAYSSIEHAGLIALGFGFGGIGIFAALLQIIYHALAKAVLFFAVGNIFIKYGSTKIANVRGVLKTLPVTAALLMMGFLAITGVPPFGLFVSELTILSAGIGSHTAIVIFVLVFLVLIFIGFLRHVTVMVHGNAPDVAHGESSYWTLVPPIVLLAALLVLGCYIPLPLRSLLDSAVATIR